jgi:hypothetical protein
MEGYLNKPSPNHALQSVEWVVIRPLASDSGDRQTVGCVQPILPTCGRFMRMPEAGLGSSADQANHY